jgi:hypothetical protein
VVPFGRVTVTVTVPVVEPEGVDPLDADAIETAPAVPSAATAAPAAISLWVRMSFMSEPLFVFGIPAGSVEIEVRQPG